MSMNMEKIILYRDSGIHLTDKDMEEVKAWSKELADGSVENDVQEH